MAVREYLTQHADQIIINNQKAAVGNCTSILFTADTSTISSIPILFDSVITPPSFRDNRSDLKTDFLEIYQTIINMFSPSITY